MKKWLFLLVTTLAWNSQVSAQGCFIDNCEQSCCGCDLVTTVDVGAGYRQDKLKWVFAGFSPGTAIHEKWNHIRMGYIEANARFVACQNILLKVDLDYAWSGWQNNHHAKLVDYNSASVTNYRKSKSECEAYDISAGLGYRFDLCYCCHEFAFTPLVGWSLHHLKFKNHAFYELPKFVHSTYFWNGPWIGFETAYQVCCDWKVYFDYSFHFGKFHTNIHEYFRHRKKEMTTYGNEFEIGTVYQWCDFWFVGLKFNYKNYWTNRSHSIFDQDNDTHHSKFALWHSYMIGVDVGYTF